MPSLLCDTQRCLRVMSDCINAHETCICRTFIRQLILSLNLPYFMPGCLSTDKLLLQKCCKSRHWLLGASTDYALPHERREPPAVSSSFSFPKSLAVRFCNRIDGSLQPHLNPASVPGLAWNSGRNKMSNIHPLQSHPMLCLCSGLHSVFLSSWDKMPHWLIQDGTLFPPSLTSSCVACSNRYVYMLHQRSNGQHHLYRDRTLQLMSYHVVMRLLFLDVIYSISHVHCMLEVYCVCE